MLNFFTIQPAPHLREYVRYFWVLEGDASTSRPYLHRNMADASPELLFHYKGRFEEILHNGKIENSFISGIHGPTSNYQRFSITSNFGMIGAYLYPYALPALLNTPASCFTDSMPDMQELLGREGRELEEKIMMADNNISRVNLLTLFLSRKFSNYKKADDRLHLSINEIIKSNGQVKIDELAGRYCLSLRQYERRFKEFGGFGPKQFARIIRFQSSLAQYGKGGKTLTDIAYDQGYYDQSHFIHDFKQFSGYHPKQYFFRISEANEWKQ